MSSNKVCNPTFLRNFATKEGIPNACIYGQLSQMILYSPHRQVIPKCQDKHGNILTGHSWIRCAVKRLHQFIPYMTSVTIKKHLRWLWDNGFIYIGNLDNDYFSHTSWYTLNMDKYNNVKTAELKRDVSLCK